MGFTTEQRHRLAEADAQGRALVTSIDGRTVIVLRAAPTTEADADAVSEQIAKVAGALNAGGIDVDPRPSLIIGCSDAILDYLTQAAEHSPIDDCDLNAWAIAQLVVSAAEELGDDPVAAIARLGVA